MEDLGRARAALQPHATALPPEFHTDELPRWLAEMASRKQGNWALKALWRRIEALGLEEGEWSAHALLEIGVWRAIWRSGADDLRASSVRQYEIAARKLLLRHAPDRKTCCVT